MHTKNLNNIMISVQFFILSVRYQNQRHPANRPNKSSTQDNMSMNLAGSVPISDQVPTHVLSTATKKEALLPTPPSHQIVKLDTSLTCKFNKFET